jgi:hypothetical protein
MQVQILRDIPGLGRSIESQSRNRWLLICLHVHDVRIFHPLLADRREILHARPTGQCFGGLLLVTGGIG